MADWAREVRTRLASVRLAATREAEIVDELSQHLQDRHAELLAGGATLDEAVRLALEEFQSGTALAARLALLRQAHPQTPLTPAAPTGAFVTDVWLDVRSSLRQFVRQPGYAWAAVVTLALAIGANTVIFSIANVLVLKPLPFERPESLGWLLTTGPGATDGRGRISLPDYAVYRDEVTQLTRLAAYRRTPVTLRVGDEAERVLAQEVVGDLQGLWGLRMARGRPLGLTDEGPGADRVAALSHHLWMTRFGGATQVVGRQMLLDGVPHDIVGVVGPDIEVGGFADVDVWVPLAGRPEAGSRVDRAWRPVGRLAAGATLSEASARVTTVADRLAQEEPDTNRDWSARVSTGRDALTGSGDRPSQPHGCRCARRHMSIRFSACGKCRAAARRARSTVGLPLRTAGAPAPVASVSLPEGVRGTRRLVNRIDECQRTCTTFAVKISVGRADCLPER